MKLSLYQRLSLSLLLVFIAISTVFYYIFHMPMTAQG